MGFDIDAMLAYGISYPANYEIPSKFKKTEGFNGDCIGEYRHMGLDKEKYPIPIEIFRYGNYYDDYNELPFIVTLEHLVYRGSLKFPSVIKPKKPPTYIERVNLEDFCKEYLDQNKIVAEWHLVVRYW